MRYIVGNRLKRSRAQIPIQDNLMTPFIRKTFARLFTVVMVVLMLSFMGTMAQKYYENMRCIVGMIDTCEQPSDTTIIDDSVYMLQQPTTTSETFVVMANTNP